MNRIKVTLLHHTPLYIASDGARTCWSSQDKSDTSLTLVCDSCGTKSIDSEDGITNFEMNIGDDNQHECHSCKSMKNHWEKHIGSKDLALIDRVGNQYHHSSILEHISFNFFIDGISRACLQEWSRHRHMSQSVESTRYTMAKELKTEQSFFKKRTTVEVPRHLIGKFGIIDNESLLRAEKYIHLTGDNDVDYASICALENLRELVVAGKSNDIAKYALPECWRVRLTASINLRSLQNFLSLRTDKKALPEIQHLANLIYQALPIDAQSLVKHCIKLEQE